MSRSRPATRGSGEPVLSCGALRAAAIFGPNATPLDLRQFHDPGVEIVSIQDLAADTVFDAVLIFGGDGTVHRRLAASVASQSPLLCVPTGSGNDFARALGLNTVRDAARAWQ